MPAPVILPGTFDSLSPIRDYIQKAALEFGMDKRATYRLTLAVDEIATNSVMHGYIEANRQGDLMVEAQISHDKLTIILEDEGGFFDPTTIPEPYSLDLPAEERPIGGLGVFLTLKGVDEFTYERKGDRNRHLFIMHRKE
jgi:serine/threonine-protein kinase RsbW